MINNDNNIILYLQMKMPTMLIGEFISFKGLFGRGEIGDK
jgi:hypothetical protein